MNNKLTTGEKLKDLRVERHLKLEELSKEVHIATSTLSNYENDENYDISAANITALAAYYDVSTDYLLGRTENRSGNLTELKDLHLDDEVLETLRDGKINNRLLCELIRDPAFMKLMADMEIFVDGIAQTQINNINSYVDVIRSEVINKYHPDEEDKHLAILEAAHIDEGNYFADRIHTDIDEIVNRIRDAHKDDKTTMQKTSAVKEIRDSLIAVSKFKGSNDEKLVYLLCDQLGVNYKSLSSEHMQALIEVIRKSRKLKRGLSIRGKR